MAARDGAEEVAQTVLLIPACPWAVALARHLDNRAPKDCPMSLRCLSYAILLSAPLSQAALVGAVAWGAGWPVALTGAALVIPAPVATLVWMAFSIEWVLA